MNKVSKTASFAESLWDIWCIVSVVGIWPRFIEPNLLFTTEVRLPIKNLPDGLSGLKVVHFSDLHFCSHLSHHFLLKILKKIKGFNPDIILFTGDFICYSEVSEREHLENFLNSVRELSSNGVFCVVGNHDYERFVSIDDNGKYSLVNNSPQTITRAFKRLWKPPRMPLHSEDLSVSPHPELVEIIRNSGWNLLHNRSELLTLPGGKINLCGFGEYMMGDVKIEQAYANYDRNAPGILLLHNPDAAPYLKNTPGDLILSGHTHGGQVNLPWIKKRFSLMEHPEFKKGLKKVGDKNIYITRGVGSVLPFRWLAPPELVFIELSKE